MYPNDQTITNYKKYVEAYTVVAVEINYNTGGRRPKLRKRIIRENLSTDHAKSKYVIVLQVSKTYFFQIEYQFKNSQVILLIIFNLKPLVIVI